MELRAEDIDRYALLVSPDNPKGSARLRAAVEKGERSLADIRVDRGITAALRLAALGPRSAVLLRPFGDSAVAADLVVEIIERARESGVEEISTRPLTDQLVPAYRAALLANGFRLFGERAEFKSPVEALPSEDGTPLTWRNLDETGLDAAAAMLSRTAEGDPTGHSERESPREVLTEWLADPVLTDGPGCVHVGYEGDREVAFVCAQVLPKDGWSRIAYMGLVPAARGRGLGRWVHRHGFSMIREQGGTLYHGGTSTSNSAMVHLFQAHGCKEHERMFEFEWISGAEARGSGEVTA